MIKRSISKEYVIVWRNCSHKKALKFDHCALSSLRGDVLMILRGQTASKLVPTRLVAEQANENIVVNLNRRKVVVNLHRCKVVVNLSSHKGVVNFDRYENVANHDNQF